MSHTELLAGLQACSVRPSAAVCLEPGNCHSWKKTNLVNTRSAWDVLAYCPLCTNRLGLHKSDMIKKKCLEKQNEEVAGFRNQQ